MTTATKKTATKRKGSAKKAATKSSPKPGQPKRSAVKKAVTKVSAKKNKLGVKNSLVNNINAHRKKGDSKSKKKSTVSKTAYKKMEQNWGNEKE